MLLLWGLELCNKISLDLAKGGLFVCNLLLELVLGRSDLGFEAHLGDLGGLLVLDLLSLLHGDLFCLLLIGIVHLLLDATRDWRELLLESPLREVRNLLPVSRIDVVNPGRAGRHRVEGLVGQVLNAVSLRERWHEL
jgi:hypothetical protein